MKSYKRLERLFYDTRINNPKHELLPNAGYLLDRGDDDYYDDERLELIANWKYFS